MGIRVLAQNNISFNSDYSMMWIRDNVIFAKIDGQNVVIGKYADGKRAEKVFEALHEAIGANFSIYWMPEV